MPFPDLSSFYPGYERKNSEAERRQTQVWVVIRATPTRVTTRLRFGRGSLVGVPPRLWLRRPNATTQLQFRASLAGAFKRALPANRPAAVQRCFSQTGRNAGRADNPKLPGSGLQVRPRVPHSPRAMACRPQRVRIMGEVRPVCNWNGDQCQYDGDDLFYLSPCGRGKERPITPAAVRDRAAPRTDPRSA